MRAAYTLALLAFLVSTKVLACGCSKQTAEWHPHVDKYADVIFTGEVTDVSGPDPVGIVLIKFKVLDAQRGVRGRSVTIEVHNRGTSCDLEKASFQLGAKYLMSGFKMGVAEVTSNGVKAAPAPSTRYYNNYCSLREKLP